MKAKTKQPSLRDRLSESFLKAFEADFAVHGASVIEQMRTKDPTRYAELAGKLILTAEPKSDGIKEAESMEELARKLLKQVGLENEDAATPDMIQSAIVAQDEFVAQLARIAGGN